MQTKTPQVYSCNRPFYLYPQNPYLYIYKVKIHVKTKRTNFLLNPKRTPLFSSRHISTMFISCWPCFGQFDRDAHIPTLKFVLVIFIFVMYLVLGASIFSTIEGPSNEVALTNLTKLKEQFFQQNKKCLSGELFSIF